MKRKVTLAIAVCALFFLVSVSTSQASVSHVTRGFITLKSGVVVTVVDQNTIYTRRINGKFRDMSWSCKQFLIKIPAGMVLHRDSTLRWSGKSFSFSSGQSAGKQLLEGEPSITIPLNVGIKYTNQATLRLHLARKKSPKKQWIATSIIQWRIHFSSKNPMAEGSLLVTKVTPKASPDKAKPKKRKRNSEPTP